MDELGGEDGQLLNWQVINSYYGKGCQGGRRRSTRRDEDSIMSDIVPCMGRDRGIGAQTGTHVVGWWGRSCVT